MDLEDPLGSNCCGIQRCVAPADAPVLGQHRGMGVQKKREEGKTDS